MALRVVHGIGRQFKDQSPEAKKRAAPKSVGTQGLGLLPFFWGGGGGGGGGGEEEWGGRSGEVGRGPKLGFLVFERSCLRTPPLFS